MKFVRSIAAVTMIIGNGTGIMAAELPRFEAAGLPISSVQAQLLGAANVQEQSPALAERPVLAPHQAAVLAPRTLEVARATAITSRKVATP